MIRHGRHTPDIAEKSRLNPKEDLEGQLLNNPKPEPRLF
jgi:hypothetical protein